MGRETAEASAKGVATGLHKSILEPSLGTTRDSHFHLQVALLESGSGAHVANAAQERRLSMEQQQQKAVDLHQFCCCRKCNQPITGREASFMSNQLKAKG